jgi:hypothetical protein
MESANLTQLQRVERQAYVAMAGEPDTMRLEGSLVAIPSA